MRGSIVRLITLREMRDLIRDRRTVMLILVLPAVLYPLFGLAGYVFALSMMEQSTRIGLVGAEALDPLAKTDAPEPRFPPLLERDGFAAPFVEADAEVGPLVLTRLTDDPEEALRTRQVDVVLQIPTDFAHDLEAGKAPTLTILERDGDERSKMAARRLTGIIRKWEKALKEVKFSRAGLPGGFDQVLVVEDSQSKKPKAKKAADEMRDSFARVFPFILMMWLIAGAIQPAVDLTAGEKERGTMETLLISPADRSEIVAGKFLATTLFAFASVVWNVLWLTGGALGLEALLGFPILNLPGLIGCVILGIPLAMLFSAICIALGVFARSTKEGQYYLMPLILVTMPLSFWSMMPGAEITPGKAIIPVTGAMLMQQKLLAVSSEPVSWEYWPLVLGGLAFWILLALALAVRQFKNESVLFRESGPEKINVLARIFGRTSS